MYQPYSSTGQPAGPLPPPAPKPVPTAAKLMYGGAALSAAYLIATLPQAEDHNHHRGSERGRGEPVPEHFSVDVAHEGPGRLVAVDGAGG
jgi:hypothetical protein